jgi:hypothetical protein
MVRYCDAGAGTGRPGADRLSALPVAADPPAPRSISAIDFAGGMGNAALIGWKPLWSAGVPKVGISASW